MQHPKSALHLHMDILYNRFSNFKGGIKMEIKSFDELISKMQQRTVKKNVAVVSAADEHTLEAVIQAKNAGVVSPILIGDQERIQGILKKMGEDKTGIEIVNQADDRKAAEKAVELVHQGQVHFIMKGKIQTS